MTDPKDFDYAKKLEHRLCPYTEDGILSEFLEVKNGYHHIERTSFSIDILPCENNDNCKSLKAVEKVVKKIF